MELRVLQYFLMVAMEENITKAAQRLHLTQPTLSRQIMQLEEELNVKLFKRSGRRIVLTDDGMLLKRRAQEIVSLTEKTKKEFLHGNESLSGVISIGSGELKSVYLLAEIMTSFRKKYPLVRYEMYSENADVIKERIESGLLDVGLLLAPVDIVKYEFIHMPEKEKWGALIREDSALAEKESLAPEDFLDIPLIMPWRKLVLNEVENWFGDYREKLDVVANSNLQRNASVMVKKGIGTAISIDLDTRHDGLKFLPLKPALKTESLLVWKKNQTYPPAVEAFIKYAKTYVSGMNNDSI